MPPNGNPPKVWLRLKHSITTTNYDVKVVRDTGAKIGNKTGEENCRDAARGDSIDGVGPQDSAGGGDSELRTHAGQRGRPRPTNHTSEDKIFDGCGGDHPETWRAHETLKAGVKARHLHFGDGRHSFSLEEALERGP